MIVLQKMKMYIHYKKKNNSTQTMNGYKLELKDNSSSI